MSLPKGSRAGLLWLSLWAQLQRISVAVLRGEAPVAACCAPSPRSGYREPWLARGGPEQQASRDRPLIKKTPAVIKNDGAGVTTGVFSLGSRV